jgi:hypothetical protein
VTVSVLAVAAGCTGAPVENPTATALQGTWSACTSDGVTDHEERLTFTGSDIRWVVSSFSTSDGSCGGAPTVDSDLSGSFVVGPRLLATLDAVTVEAQGIDVTDETRSFYTTVYVASELEPDGLHLGEPDAATGRDMTSTARRPNVLSVLPLLKH